MAEEKKGYFNMLGEFCREAAVLIFVFGNLDFWLNVVHDATNPMTWATLSYTFKIFGLTIVFQTVGMQLEKWRRS